ncbi:MAG: GGDEF domain-containing protein, partial [Bacillota bacterium]
RITPLLDSSGQPESFIAIKEDVTEEKELREELEFFAEMDKLTKVYNRRAGYDILNDIKTKADEEMTFFTISFIDINNLKEVNDVYGHKTGDELITNVVEIIKKTIRESDYIFRFGGDEFLLVFNYSQNEEAEKIMERIQEKLRKINQTQNHKYQMSISYGIECYDPNKKIVLDELISRADDKMYQYKQEYKENNNLPQR